MSQCVAETVSVVTGASSGIGRAVATALAERGGTVVLAARNAAALEEVARECARRGGRALALPVDMAEEGSAAFGRAGARRLRAPRRLDQ
jgi:short-subunit dehydrogenase